MRRSSLDSTFAPAYAGLADCYAQMGSVRVGEMKPLEALAQCPRLICRGLWIWMRRSPKRIARWLDQELV